MSTDAMMSGMGWATQFVSKVTKRLRKNGWTNDQIHALVTEDGEDKLHRGVDAFAEALTMPGQLFELPINFDRSVEELVKAGNYDYANSNITSENFPSDRSGKQNVKVRVLTTEDLFGEYRSTTTEEVLDALRSPNRHGGDLETEMIPAGQRHGIYPLLTLGIQHPDQQREAPIVELGVDWVDSDGDRDVPSLYSGAGGRELNLIWRGFEWCQRDRFLAVRA